MRPRECEIHRMPLVGPTHVTCPQSESGGAESPLNARENTARAIELPGVDKARLKAVRGRLPTERIFVERRAVQRMLAFQGHAESPDKPTRPGIDRCPNTKQRRKMRAARQGLGVGQPVLFFCRRVKEKPVGERPATTLLVLSRHRDCAPVEIIGRYFERR